MTFSDKMKEEAIGYGLCQQWTDEWKNDSTMEELLDKMIKGIDFCIKHNFPSVKTMEENKGEVLHKKGIYCNEKASLEDVPFAFIAGDSNVSVVCDSDISEIYVRHTSKATVTAENGARVWVNAIDYAEIDIKCDKFSKVFVHNYGDCKITFEGNVSIKSKPSFFGSEYHRA